MQIFNVGSLNIDHVYRLDHIVAPGETIAAGAYACLAGGKGANQSIAIARAGGSVVHVGKTGREGQWMVDAMQRDGVDVTRIDISDNPGGHAIIQVDARGQNAIVIHGGANQDISEKQIDKALAMARSGDVLLLQNETSIIPYAMNLARQKGLTVCFNPAPMGPEVLSYPLETVNIFVVNETEGAALSGMAADSPDAVIENLRQRFPRAAVVLTLGARGVVYTGADQRCMVAGRKVVAVDTTAAGDCFIGYLLASLQKGLSIENALQRATAASAISVTRSGAAQSIPWDREVG